MSASSSSPLERRAKAKVVFQRMQQAFRESLPQRLEAVQQLWRTLSNAPTTDALAELQHITHTLVGSAGTFGFRELATAAQAIEHYCQSCDQTVADPDWGARCWQLQPLLVALTTAGQHPKLTPTPDKAAVAGQVVAKNSAPSSGRVYVVDDDPIQARQLATQLTLHGFQTEALTSLATLQTAIRDQAPPAAVVLDIAFPNDDLAGIHCVQSLKQSRLATIPVIFISAQGGITTRLQALRAGGEGFFSKPVVIPALAVKLQELIGESTSQAYRVLLIDDDQEVLAVHGAWLQEAGYELVTGTDSGELIEQIHAKQPDVVLIDMHMPQISGLELARLIRQEEALLDLPIIFLSAEQDLTLQQQAMRNGGFSFLTKPVQPSTLIETVRSWAIHYRRLQARKRYLARIDPVTGLFNRSHFLSLLESHRVQQQRQGVQAALFVEFDRFLPILRHTPSEIVNQLRIQVAERIKAQLAADDIVGVYSDSIYVIWTPQPSVELLNQLGDRLCKTVVDCPLPAQVQPARLSVSIGAALVRDNKDLKRTLAEAAQACTMAQQSGGNAVQLHDELKIYRQRSAEEQVWLTTIKRGLREQRFFLVYQPMTSTTSQGTQDNFEVLVRMLDDNQQVILPGQFLPPVQQLGLMGVLDRWVVRQALQNLKLQLEFHSNIRFFIKISHLSAIREEFLGWMTDVVGERQDLGRHCVFQVDWGIVQSHSNILQPWAARLHDCGSTVVVENVTLQAESHPLLEQLPADYIKLDRSVVRHLGQSEQVQRELQQFTHWCHERHIQVIAAYVENADSMALLYNLRIDLIQGYFLQHPQQSIQTELD